MAFIFPLSFDHTHRLSVHKQDIISRTGIGLIFPDSKTRAEAPVDGLLIHNHPAGLFKELIYAVSRFLLRCLVHIGCLGSFQN
jgi:hypothetical protein